MTAGLVLTAAHGARPTVLTDSTSCREYARCRVPGSAVHLRPASVGLAALGTRLAPAWRGVPVGLARPRGERVGRCGEQSAL